ncbi:MAG: hypothetical protein NTX35_09510 [Verrucomicrobia bacterium]|nr:hypothetical protein [Verrucomicrobiota bacterium]
MSTLTAPLPTDLQDLRPLLHRRLDEATPEELTAVHNVLLEMEARRLYETLGAEMDGDWAAGRLTKENIEEAIAAHRGKHPYR